MPRFAANLTMMFNEWEFLDRFAAAADAGFEAVEFLFPYDFPPEQIAARVERNGLTVALFNHPPGDFAKGERGVAVFPERREEFRAGLERALVYAQALGVKRTHLMAGRAPADSAAADAALRDALREAVALFAPAGIDIVIEPLNARDNPGYFLNDFRQAEEIIASLASPSLKLQFDLYHCQIMHGDVAMRLRAAAPIIGHVQIASVPERNEPDDGELNYRYLFAELDRVGYSGFVGCEYRPRGGTLDGLGWMKTLV